MVRLACAASLLLVCATALFRSAAFLIVDRPEKSDVVLVLNGGWQIRAKKGAELVHAGFGHHLLVDTDHTLRLGIADSDRIQAVLLRKFPDLVNQVQICPTLADSTLSEAADIAVCLQRLNAKSVLLVTSDFHTRRAFSILRHALPQYHWSVAAAPDEVFQVNWWRDRRSVLTNLSEWEKLVWWEVVERW
jgi:uncharacterized SAM-binding protein YcdF (DUF218 family)